MGASITKELIPNLAKPLMRNLRVVCNYLSVLSDKHNQQYN